MAPLNIASQKLQDIIALTIEAGLAALHIYQQADYQCTQKSDDSPLTIADTTSHQIISNGLTALDASVPILSEEGRLPPFDVRKAWQRYWLIDPLDGTKEFIEGNGEFTINIALIEDGKPVAGFVYAPVLDLLYYAVHSQGAKKVTHASACDDFCKNAIPLSTRAMCDFSDKRKASEICVVASRRHGTEGLAALKQVLSASFENVIFRQVGSSLKICMVAEGQADMYPRFGPTSEWDTAAAHAIVLEAGGKIMKKNLNPLRYNKKDSILNPNFLVVGDPSVQWREILLTF